MRINVKVTPKAVANRIVEKDGLFRVYVTAAPEDGKANKAVIRLLAKHFDVAPSMISIFRGETAREKTIDIKGIGE